MSVAERLKVSEEEVIKWSPARLARWLAYYRILNEDEKKAMEAAQRKARNKGGGGGSNNTTIAF